METSVSAEPRLDATSLFTFLRDKATGPMSPADLARALELSDDTAAALPPLLNELCADGRIVETRGRYGCPDRMNLVVGTVSAHPDGFAFVASLTGGGDDLFIPGHRRGGAQHGDRVVARHEHRRRSGKVEGRIIRILERARTTVVGTVRQAGPLVYVQPRDARLGRQILVPSEAMGDAQPGQIVQVEIKEYPSDERSAVGEVLEVLGDAGDPSVDIDVIIREYGLIHVFPEEVARAAEAVPTEVTEAEIEGRTDFRELPIVTIDGESAQDFDDAVHVELLPNGCYRLHVHIADVGHYVEPGSAIDTEARRRATSVYFPGHVIPMLPESLSNEICSLKPGVDRLVQSALIDIDRDGRTVKFEFHDGVIRSAERLTYRQVAAFLDGDDAAREQFASHTAQLERMRELAEVLMRARRERGSIDFDLPEPEIIIGLRGETEDIVKAERNIAHRIIEEFMIRANEVVASHLVWEDVPALHRNHEGPDPVRVEALREFISGLGHTMGGGKEPQPRHFAELLSRLDGRPEERVISTLVLRTMKRARYGVDADGHFGLAAGRYTHFTSPIRRYPDLIVHRALRADRAASQEEGEATAAAAPPADLAQIAAQCSQQERRAEEAEREYCAWKKVQFMAERLGEHFEGHVTGVQSFGMFVELEPYFVQGLIPVSTLHDDYYQFDEARHTLKGENTDQTFTLGDRLEVSVAKADLERRRLDLALEGGPLIKAKPPEAPKRRRRRGGRGSRGGRAQVAEGSKKQEETPDAVPAEIAAESADRPAGEKSGGRRRGRRGGRRRRGGRKSQDGASEQEPRVAKEAGGTETASEERQERSSRPERDRASRGRSGGRSRGRSASGRGSSARPAAERRAGGGDKRAKDDGGKDSSRGRGKRTRGRARKPAASGPLPAPVRPEPRKAEPARKEEGDSKAPKANPYLTDVDY